MEPTPQSSIGDRSPAHPLEISVALASSVEQVLFRFAEKAELETALVVDHSGALVSGISADEGQDVDVISALAAGASGAIQALVKKLGDSSEVESFHHGSGQVVYLAGVGGRFVLVGVCRGGTSIGAIREEARQVRPSLASLLATLDATQTAAQERPPVDPTPARPQAAPHLAGPEARRPLAVPIIARASETSPRPAEVPARSGDSGKLGDSAAGEDFPPQVPGPAADPETLENSEPGAREGAEFEDEATPGAVVESDAVADSESESGFELESLPTGIVEYLGEESPEVVIEPSLVSAEGVSASPFEVEEEEGIPFEAGGGNDERLEDAARALGTEPAPAEEEVSAESRFEFEMVEEFETVETFEAVEAPVEVGAGAAAEVPPGEGGFPASADVESATPPPPLEAADFPPPPASVTAGAARKILKSVPEPPRSLFEIDADEDVAFEGEPPALGSSGLLEAGSFDLSAFELDFDESEEPPPVSSPGERTEEDGSATRGLAGSIDDASDLFEDPFVDPFVDENPFEDADDTRDFGFEPDSVRPPGPAGASSGSGGRGGDSGGEASGGLEPDIPPFDPSGDSRMLEDEEEEEEERGVSAKGPFYF